MPLLYRVSATDWHVHGEKKDGEYISWGEEQTALFAAELLKVGVDLIDVSSAGNEYVLTNSLLFCANPAPVLSKISRSAQAIKSHSPST